MADAATPKLSPEDATKAAAHFFLSELRTRISTQPLPYQHGDEARALESLWEVFGQAREAMKKYPGCVVFADKVTEMLNLHLRPMTAKWHRAKIEGRLDSRDGADEFRGELENVQQELRRFASELHDMAYGVPKEDGHSPDVIKDGYLDAYLAGLDCEIAPIRLLDVEDDATRAQIKTLNEQFGEINKAERKVLKERRKLYGLANEAPDAVPEKSAIGLALSGGGIRSATFCLGVVQVLAERGLFKEIDFLSTVSGGGYTGSFITTRLGALEGPPKATPAERMADALTRQKAIADPNGPDPGAIRHLRQRAKYLAALDVKQAWLMVTGTLGGLLLNWTAPLFLITLAAALVSAAGGMGAVKGGWTYVFGALAAILLVTLSLYGWRLGRTPATKAAIPWALALAATVAAGVVWLLSFGYGVAIDPKSWTATSGLVATLITAGPAILRFVPIVKNPAVRKIALQVLLVLAAIVVPLIAITAFYLLVYFGTHCDLGIPLLFVASAVCALYAFLGLNINFTGPHRLYRDQLARTFVQFGDTNTTPVLLPEINRSGYAPYHLINTTLNVPSSLNAALRERKSDFFLFSKGYTGSPATGYFPTGDWRANSAAPDLATAMAISGAAASSYMGLGSMPTLASLLTFLNVRLGFWIRNQKKPSAWGYPGFGCLMREMFGVGMTEDEHWLNLSDGGHIENLAIYELLRRRCKLIISVDGEADPNYTFEGLMTLVRHAQIDFGARIKVDLSDIRPDPKTGYSRSHAALCTIYYADGSLGFMIYMKLSVTGNESEMIRRYRINHADFPHQSTLDQFFDEEQFEVYRQLGVHVADGLFLPALMSPVRAEQIDSVEKWFRQLVRNLLPGTIPGVRPIGRAAPASPAIGGTAATPAGPPAS
jgi:hypothetical protein